jgi:hypothetical protein
VTETGSSVPRRQLGRHLKAAREGAALSLEAAARALEWSKAKMYRIEAGQVPLRTHDVIAMCSVYRCDAELRDALLGLSAEAKAKGWWHAYGDAIPAWFELYVGLEAAASRLRKFEAGLVPGLLQTEDYAAAVAHATPGRPQSEVDKLVALRMERQQLLTRHMPPPIRLDVILDEAVLHRPIGDRAGMRRQLTHLASMAQGPRTTIRVLPLGTGPHLASIAGNFMIMEFPAAVTGPVEPTTIYSENLTGALYLDKPGEVAAYDAAWGTLGELALDPGASADLISSINEESFDA